MKTPMTVDELHAAATELVRKGLGKRQVFVQHILDGATWAEPVHNLTPPANVFERVVWVLVGPAEN